MATMQKERLRPLTIAEQREMKRIVKASSERVDRVHRATALLAVAGGQTFAVAAEAAGYRSPQAVTYLVRRFNQVGLEALEIAAGVPSDGVVLKPWPTPKRSVSLGTTLTSSAGTPSSSATSRA